MSRKPPATATSGTTITAADIEAAERNRVMAASLRLQQATAQPPPMTPEQVEAAALFDRLDRQPTAEEMANRLEAARLQDIALRNAEGADDCRAYAARLRASGYQGWTGGDR